MARLCGHFCCDGRFTLVVPSRTQKHSTECEKRVGPSATLKTISALSDRQAVVFVQNFAKNLTKTTAYLFRGRIFEKTQNSFVEIKVIGEFRVFFCYSFTGVLLICTGENADLSRSNYTVFPFFDYSLWVLL